MSRGVPLTPDQLETMARVFSETGNASEAARAIGVETSTVTRRLAGAREQRRATLHARACARGMRLGRKRLVAAIELAYARLNRTDPPIADRDFGSVMNALRGAVDAVASLDERLERARQARLTREKTRAETALARAKARGDAPPDITVNLTDPDAVDALVRKHFGQSGAKRVVTDDGPPPDARGGAGG